MGGQILGYDNHHLIRNRSVLEKKIPANELEEENLCRDIVVWKPWFPVLTGDFQWLFNWLRMNPSEKAPHMVFPVVVYSAVVAGPTPPTKLAAILQALEVGTSELPEPEYAKATSELDSDEEMEDAQADDLPKDHSAETAVPFGRNSGAPSSGETSALMGPWKLFIRIKLCWLLGWTRKEQPMLRFAPSWPGQLQALTGF